MKIASKAASTDAGGGARSGNVVLSREHMQALAVRAGLPATTPTAEIIAEVNRAPLAENHTERIAKRDRLIDAAVAAGAIEEDERDQWAAAYAAAPQIAEVLTERTAAAQKPKAPAKLAAVPKPAPVAASARMSSEEITTEVHAAVADRRIHSAREPHWRGRLRNEGRDAARALRALPPIEQLLAASSEGASTAEGEPPSLLEQRPAGLLAGIDDAAAARKAAESAPATTPAGDAGVVTDPQSGALSWNGLPVSAGPDGAPLVHTTGGAMTPAAFKSAGLDAETELAAVGLARLTGTAQGMDLPKPNLLLGGG